MNCTTRQAHRLGRSFRCLTIQPQPQRYASSAPIATHSNWKSMLPEQQQYGKPNKPTPASTHKRLDQIHANIPVYPYPRKYWFKKANLGLYGHLSIRHGNTISERNKHRNPRIWRANIHRKRLWSVALGRFIRLKVATRIIRTVDKCGGLDNYLLGNRPGRIREMGMAGWALRWRLLRTPLGRARILEERKALGLDGEPLWMSLPFAEKWLAAHEAKHGLASMEDLTVQGSAVSMNRAIPVVATTADEEAALELERQIDEEFNADDEAAARGEDGGIELGSEGEHIGETTPHNMTRK